MLAPIPETIAKDKVTSSANIMLRRRILLDKWNLERLASVLYYWNTHVKLHEMNALLGYTCDVLE